MARSIISLFRRSAPFASALALASALACSSSLEADGDPDFDNQNGLPNFQGPLNPSPNDNGAAPGNGSQNPNSPLPGNGNTNPEQNPGQNGSTPIDGQGPGNTAGGMGGSAGQTDPGAMTGSAGSAIGSAGSTGLDPNSNPNTPPVDPPIDPVDPPLDPPDPPPPPTNPGPSPAEVAAFFAGLPCGAKYTALGDGGWTFCARLSDGGGACANPRGSATFTRATFQGGAAVTNVAQISGMQESNVAVVTTAGALHIGQLTSIPTTPRIASGVINVSGGFHGAAALVENGAGFRVMSWADNGAPANVTLPPGVQPIQVSANYGLACALSTAGDVYCWDAGGNHSLGLTATPSLMDMGEPVKMISVGQNSVCGVTFGDTLTCDAAWYDSPWLPTEGNAPDFRVRQTTFPEVREVHAGFNQGIVVRGDGAAFFLPGGRTPPVDNPGTQFAGAADVIAAGGDRGNACVQTRAGALFCMSGGTTTSRATLGGAPLTVSAAACPR